MTPDDLTHRKELEMDLELALQTHRSIFESLHSKVRDARVNCQRLRSDFAKQQGPIRGGAHYRNRGRAGRSSATVGVAAESRRTA